MTAVPLSFIPLAIPRSWAHFPEDDCRPGFQPVARALWRVSAVLFPFIADCIYSTIFSHALSSGKPGRKFLICTVCIRVKYGFYGKK